MAADSSFSIVYSNSRLLMEKSLEWTRASRTPIRVSVTDQERRTYNLNCTINVCGKDTLILATTDALSLPSLRKAECLLYVESAPHSTASQDMVAGKAGVFVCHTRIQDQREEANGHSTLIADSVGRIEFRELRRFRRSDSCSDMDLAAIWLCEHKLPLCMNEMATPNFVCRAGNLGNMTIMDLSAGGMRLRVPHIFEQPVPMAKGSTLLCIFGFGKGEVKVMTAGRVISCQPVSVTEAETRIQFTHYIDGTDDYGKWQWRRLGQSGVLALNHWVNQLSVGNKCPQQK